jgi:hypothetical protein
MGAIKDSFIGLIVLSVLMIIGTELYLHKSKEYTPTEPGIT